MLRSISAALLGLLLSGQAQALELSRGALHEEALATGWREFQAPLLRASFPSSGKKYPGVSSGSCSTAPTVDLSASANVTSGPTSPVTLTGTTQTNDVIEVFFKGGTGGATGSTIADVPGALTWTLRKEQLYGGGTTSVFDAWVAIATSAITNDVITVTNAGPGLAGLRTTAIAVHGANLTTPNDPNASLPAISANSATSVSSITLSGITTTNKCDLIIATVAASATSAISPYTVPSGFANFVTGGTGTLQDVSDLGVTAIQSSASYTYGFGASGVAVFYLDAIQSP